MRGTHDNYEVSIYKHGIIPAYAGNTWTGEGSSESVTGSSPRMRGTHTDRLERSLSLGIIPAYAGNTNDC